MQNPPFFGWRVVAAAFTAQFLANASTFAIFGVFVVPLSEEFGVSQGRFGQGMTLAFLAMGALGPLVGKWLDRGHARAVLLSGALIAGLGLMLLSRATAFWQLAVIFCGVVSVGTALFGPTPSTTLVANWFVRRRGLALGIAVAGATVAGPVGSVSAAWLIDEVGWRTTLVIAGAVVLAVGLPVFALSVIGRPEDVGQTMDGLPPEEGTADLSVAGNAVETATLVRDPRLWLMAVGWAMVFTSPIVLMLTLVPFGEQLGFSRQQASYFFVGMAPFSILGKVLFGAFAERIPIKTAVWLVIGGNALVWVLLVQDPSFPVYLAVGALYGAAIGAAGPLQGVAIGRLFGREAFGRAQGIGGLASLPLIAAAPTVAGMLRDATGSYHAAFQLQIALLLAGGVFLTLVSYPKRATS